eukprot:106915_1
MQHRPAPTKTHCNKNQALCVSLIISLCIFVYLCYKSMHDDSNHFNVHRSRSLLSSSPLLSEPWVYIDSHDLGTIARMIHSKSTSALNSKNASTSHSPNSYASSGKEYVNLGNITAELRVALDKLASPEPASAHETDTGTSESFFHADHVFVSSIHVEAPPNSPSSHQQTEPADEETQLSRLMETATDTDASPLMSEVHREAQGMEHAQRNDTDTIELHKKSKGLTQRRVIRRTTVSDIRLEHGTKNDTFLTILLQDADSPMHAKSETKSKVPGSLVRLRVELCRRLSGLSLCKKNDRDKSTDETSGCCGGKDKRP